MRKKIRFHAGEIQVGHRLPWAVYSADGALLLKAGGIISSPHQLDILLNKGFYRGPTPQEEKTGWERHSVESESEHATPAIHYKNVFKAKRNCAKQIEILLSGLVTERSVNVVDLTASICDQISVACKENTNAALASVHLFKDFNYGVIHPLDTAILCDVVIRRLGFKVEQERAILAAALTMNIGMYKLQEHLLTQSAPLTDEQQKEIVRHPGKSVEILKRMGVNDENWLAFVAQHHERIDGMGYPDNLKNHEILQGAKIIALADIYSAMTTPRSYRKPVMAQAVLRNIFTSRGKEIDDGLAELFIREVGIYPPGTFVKLANSEVALVIKRAVSKDNAETIKPLVCSILSPRGGRYQRFIMRDTSNELYAITGGCDPDIGEAINYPELWGYK